MNIIELSDNVLFDIEIKYKDDEIVQALIKHIRKLGDDGRCDCEYGYIEDNQFEKLKSISRSVISTFQMKRSRKELKVKLDLLSKELSGF